MGTLLLPHTALTRFQTRWASSQTPKTRGIQQLQQPQVPYLLRVQLPGRHLDCEGFVGPQRTHILKRETNQDRSSG